MFENFRTRNAGALAGFDFTDDEITQAVRAVRQRGSEPYDPLVIASLKLRRLAGGKFDEPEARNVYNDPRFVAFVDEFADTADTIARAMSAVRVLMGAKVGPGAAIPHLETAMKAAAQYEKLYARFKEIVGDASA